MKKILKRLRDPEGRGRPALCPEEAFRLLLKRERARADRGNIIFSLVVFDFSQGRKSRSSGQLIELLQGRIRITDCIGWLSDCSIGVFLADAPREGAQSFLKDVLPLIHTIQPEPECSTYTYPEFSGGSGSKSVFAAQAVGRDSTSTDLFFNEIFAMNPSLWRLLIEGFVAGFALLMLSPLLLLIGLSIKLTSPGPVIYSQFRIGHKGREFCCFKFRTMHLDVATTMHENYFKTLMATDVPMSKLDHSEDPRVFKVGRFLRASSLDELPQLFNILRGEMSFIGPRPAIPCEYRGYLPWHRHRIDVLPGLTGLWQVSGKNKTTFTEMMRFDMRYAHCKSLRQDLWIVFKTLPVIIEQFAEDCGIIRPCPESGGKEHKWVPMTEDK